MACIQGTDIKSVLLTSGRLPVSLELARAFHAAGWRIVVADPWPMHLCRMSSCVAVTVDLPAPQDNPEHFAATLERRCVDHDIDLVVPVSEETPYVAALRERAVPVFTSAPDTVLTLHDKLSFIRRAAEAELSVPATVRADHDSKTIRQTAFVRKPRFSCSGRDVSFHAAGSDVREDSAFIVQQRIEGDAINVFGIAVDGVLRLSSAYRGRLVDGSVAIAFEREEQANACTSWASRFVAATGYTGLIAFDFIVDDDGIAWPLECNPRATSGIHFLNPAAIIAAITNDELPIDHVKPVTRMAEKWSCFTRYLASLGTRDATRQAWQVLTGFSDVSWQRDDPWPFLTMPFNSWRILLKSRQKNHTFASAAVADIEWRPTERAGGMCDDR